MYTVEVAPLVRGAFKGSLTFFSRTPAPTGSVVRASVRNRLVPALVLACTDVREGKLDVKSAGYTLKKLAAGEPKQLFSSPVMRAMSELSHFFVTSDAAVLAELSFSSLLTTPRKLAEPQNGDVSSSITPEVLTLQAERGERMQAYRNLVRESFARGRSVMIIAPTLVEVERLKTELERGIEERVVIASSGVSPKELRRAWDKTADSTEPLVLIGTPPALTFPIARLDAVVVERESARAYVSRTRGLDLRRAAERIAFQNGARCILADFPLRAETFARRDLGSADDLARPQVRTQSLARITVVDARLTDPKRETRRSFTALQPATYESIQDVVGRGGHVVVYAARKGIAPLTVCNDCGTPITDPSTDTPMVLHKTPAGNVFISHRSGAVLPAERSCAVCGGWNLVSLGIGVDRVLEEIKKRIPKASPILFTADTVETHKSAERLMHAYDETPGAILVGTERMLPYLHNVELVIIASIDSVLSLSSWRAHEHALQTLYALVDRANERAIIETRRPDSAVLKSIANGSPIEYLREELRERKAYGYPPFATFIGLTWHGTEAECAKIGTLVTEALSEYDLVGPLPPEMYERGRYRERAVVRREPGTWPDEELEAALRGLPESVSITVDPDDIV